MEGCFIFQWGDCFSDGGGPSFLSGGKPHGGGISFSGGGRGLKKIVRWGGCPALLPAPPLWGTLASLWFIPNKYSWLAAIVVLAGVKITLFCQKKFCKLSLCILYFDKVGSFWKLMICFFISARKGWFWFWVWPNIAHFLPYSYIGHPKRKKVYFVKCFCKTAA